MAESNNVTMGINVGGWIFLTFYACFVIATTHSIPRDKICYFQRNLLYVNSLVLTIVTPLFLLSKIFVYYGESGKGIAEFTGNDLPLWNYCIFILGVQIFSLHQIVNLTRIVYETKGLKHAKALLTVIAFYKMLFYFLISQCLPYILLSFFIITTIDYGEHLVATFIYIKMMCQNNKSSDNSGKNNEANKSDIELGSAAKAAEAGDSKDVNNGILFELEHAVSIQLRATLGSTNEEIIYRRAKWGLFAVLAHMFSIVPLLCFQLLKVEEEEYIFQLVLVFAYLVIALSIYCYKWLIVNTPPNWQQFSN